MRNPEGPVSLSHPGCTNSGTINIESAALLSHSSNMPANTCPLLNLPLELISTIPEYLPLYSHPKNTLSLALTSRSFHTIFFPILYAHLILNTQKEAASILRTIIINPTRGSWVRGIHCYSALSPETQRSGFQDTSLGVETPAIALVEDVIMSGFVPFLHTLELHLDHCPGRTAELGSHTFWGSQRFWEIGAPFWEGLCCQCPALHTLILPRFADFRADPPLNESGIFKAQVCGVLSPYPYTLGS
jgi:hypothetical protein